MAWDQLLDAVEQADVVILGEQHDDGRGHQLQRLIVLDTLAREMERPATAIAFEMLERDEQVHIEDYLTGISTREQFAERTGSANWAGKGSWANWYQPVIDAAKDAGAPVIAANAPARYVTLARTDGFARLEDLTPLQRSMFGIPITINDPDAADYRARFYEAMDVREEEPSEGADGDEQAPHPQPQAVAHGGPMTVEQGEAFFRAQMLRDATMAESILDAFSQRGVRRVILLVGQFHSDFTGGTVGEVRARQPEARVFTISLRPGRAAALAEGDAGRADAVIYTGRE